MYNFLKYTLVSIIGTFREFFTAAKLVEGLPSPIQRVHRWWIVGWPLDIGVSYK